MGRPAPWRPVIPRPLYEERRVAFMSNTPPYEVGWIVIPATWRCSEDHAFAEAYREVECWLRGEVYQWNPYPWR